MRWRSWRCTVAVVAMFVFGISPSDTASMTKDDELEAPCMTEDGKQGVCVVYYQCEPETRGEERPEERRERRKRDVGKEVCDSYLDMCCLTHHVNRTRRESAQMPASSDGPLPQCGYSDRKVNDLHIEDDVNTAQFGEYPWMVAIIKQSEPNTPWTKFNYVGGGSIIHPKVVLTTAHKIDRVQPKDIKCRAGEWDSQTDKELYRHQDRNVNKIVLHEDYYRPTAINDVALIFLETPFEISADTPHMGVACLGHTLPAPGTKCESMGWGNENFNNPDKYSVMLRKVELPLVSRDSCQNTLRTTRLGAKFLLHQSSICAGGQKGVDICIGDVGSPLVCLIEDRSESAYARYAIYGTVAWAIVCGEDGLPGAYVNVPEFRPWIVKTVQAEGLDPSSFEYTE